MARVRYMYIYIVCMQLTAFQYVRYALNLQSHHDAMACEACSACSSSACMRDICIKTFTNDITEPGEALKIWGKAISWWLIAQISAHY